MVRADSSNADGQQQQEEVEDIHDTDCYVCKNGGDLICCDGCTKVYHAYCHKPKLKSEFVPNVFDTDKLTVLVLGMI